MKIIHDLYFKHKRIFERILLVLFIILFLMPIITTKHVQIGKAYTNRDDVALYIKTYHELPSNYITKYGMETASLHGGDLTNKVIGGDTHWNTNELADFKVSSTTHLKECDITGDNYNLSTNRGRDRLVYTANTKNVRVFYCDHYEVGTFEEITSFHLQSTRNIFWIIFLVYTLGTSAFLVFCYSYKTKPKQIDVEVIEG